MDASQNHSLEAENQGLRIENQELKAENKELLEEIDEQKDNLEELAAKVIELDSELRKERAIRASQQNKDSLVAHQNTVLLEKQEADALLIEEMSRDHQEEVGKLEAKIEELEKTLAQSVPPPTCSTRTATTRRRSPLNLRRTMGSLPSFSSEQRNSIPQKIQDSQDSPTRTYARPWLQIQPDPQVKKIEALKKELVKQKERTSQLEAKIEADYARNKLNGSNSKQGSFLIKPRKINPKLLFPPQTRSKSILPTRQPAMNQFASRFADDKESSTSLARFKCPPREERSLSPLQMRIQRLRFLMHPCKVPPLVEIESAIRYPCYMREASSSKRDLNRRK